MPDTNTELRGGMSLLVNDEMAIKNQNRVYEWFVCSNKITSCGYW